MGAEILQRRLCYSGKGVFLDLKLKGAAVRKLVGVALLLAGAMLVLLWGTEFPLGVTGEWLWQRVSWDEIPMGSIIGQLLLTGVAAGVYAGTVWLGARRLPAAGRTEVAFCLIAAVAAGSFWLSWLQDALPSPQARQKVPLVLYYPGSSGYFSEARYFISDLGEFLAGYEKKMSEGDVLHVGTHPPGLFVLHYGLIKLCESSPRLTDFLVATQPESVREAFDTIAANARGTAFPLRKPDRAAIWLAALISQWVSVATLIPLYLLLRLWMSPSVAWKTIVFWPLVPALAVFQPKSDVLYPFLGCLFLWLWLLALQRKSWWRGLLAGVVFWLAMMFSLAILPVGFLAVIVTIGRLWESEHSLKSLGILVGWATLGLVLPIIAVAGLCDLNLPVVWWWNFRNHAGFYDQYPRTYFKWLPGNLFELAWSVGLPLLVLSVIGLLKPQPRSLAWLTRGSLVVWVLLWLSGKNMGEAARLWLFLDPWFVWMSAPVWLSESSAPEDHARRTWWGILFALQLLLCLGTVLRVTGFHFAPAG